MIDKQPLLSICIPTYNRAQYLDNTINSIVTDSLFSSGEVELVVSDNCSTDDTKTVVEKYQNRYNNIIYNRNEENIVDANFVKVLSLGRGIFLKLYNDTALFYEGTLSFLLQTVKKNLDKKPVLFFPNGDLPHTRIIEKQCASFAEFVDTASFYSTWIGTFGIWKEDFDQLTDLYKSVDLLLWQTDIVFRLTSHKKTIIYNKRLVNIQELQKKGGYNLFRVFADNYLSLYQKYIDNKYISKHNFNKEKKRLFRYFFIPWMKTLSIEKNDIYDFETNKGIKTLYKHYKTFLIFYLGLGYLTAYKCLYKLKK